MKKIKEIQNCHFCGKPCLDDERIDCPNCGKPAPGPDVRYEKGIPVLMALLPACILSGIGLVVYFIMQIT